MFILCFSGVPKGNVWVSSGKRGLGKWYSGVDGKFVVGDGDRESIRGFSGSASEVTQEHPAYLRQRLRQHRGREPVYSRANGGFVAGDGDRGSGGGFGQWQRQRVRVRV